MDGGVIVSWPSYHQKLFLSVQLSPSHPEQAHHITTQKMFRYLESFINYLQIGKTEK